MIAQLTTFWPVFWISILTCIGFVGFIGLIITVLIAFEDSNYFGAAIAGFFLILLISIAAGLLTVFS